MPQNVKEMIARFPTLFDVTEDSEFCVPVGWIAYVENALRAFQATGISVKISGIRIDSGILRAVAPTDVRGRESVGVSLLNAFIAGAGKLCIFCGKPLTTGDWEIRQGRIGGCQRCIKKFGLAWPEQDTHNHEEENKYLNGDFDSWS